jgi:hypothetical protein
MINTELGSEKAVLDEMRNIDVIKECCIIYGIYDIAAKIGANSMDKLNEEDLSLCGQRKKGKFY